MKTYDVLDPTQSVIGHYFLEASAGTGKTFTIENVFPRIVLESKELITIEQILVVTFTRAATRELKSRIHAHLMHIAAALRSGIGGPPYIQKYFEAGGETLEIARRKIEEACFCFEKAQIFTLHGFAVKMLQRFAFAAHSFTPSPASSPHEDFLELLYIKDFLRTQITEHFLSSSQLTKIYTRTGKSSDDLCSAIVHILEKADNIRSYPTALERYHMWLNALQTFSMTKEELWQHYTLQAPRLAKSKKREDQVERIFSYLAKGSCSFAEWDALLGEKELFLAKISSYKPERDNPVFEKMRQTLVSLHQEAMSVDILLLQLAKACQIFYVRGKKQHSIYRPDDFIAMLKQALSYPSFIEKVQGAYQALIIDEFQDTDEAQWTIFSNLFLQRTKQSQAVYLVGDPKQSIYGFRSADVYMYLQAKRMFSADAQYCLLTNFRSHPELVQALNRVFSFDLPVDWMFLPSAGEGLQVRPVEARSHYESSFNDDKKARVHFFLYEEEVGKTVRFPSIETEETYLLPYVAREILRLKKVPVDYKQIAILVKDRYQAERVEKILQQYKIPCQMQKSISVQGNAFLSMWDLIDCLVSPKDLSKIKKFLGGSVMGYSEQELWGDLENPLLHKTREYLAVSVETIRSKGFGAFLIDFFASPGREEGVNIAEQLLSSTQDHLYGEMRQLCQIIVQYCPDGPYDVRAIQEFLSSLQRKEYKELLYQYAEQEEDQVHVMTLHKSKGLEFSIVFALSVACRHSGKEEYFLIRNEKEKELIASSEGDTHRAYKEEVDAEKLRQLYVALTRAKERVYIPLITRAKPKEMEYGTASGVELFFGSRGLAKASFIDSYAKIENFTRQGMIDLLTPLVNLAAISYEEVLCVQEEEKGEKMQAPILYPPTSRSLCFEQGFLQSFSSLVQDTESSVDFSFMSNLLEENKVPLGAQTGVVVHAILDALCKADLHHTWTEAAQDIIQQHCRGTIVEGKEAAVMQMIFDALGLRISSSLGDIILANVPAQDMRSEIEFLYPVGNSLMKGFIDLIFRFQGRYFVVDWKTNALPEEEGQGIESAIEQCMQKHRYDIQAAIYAKALQKYLRIVDTREFSACFGGAIYVFLREKKVKLFVPDMAILDTLEQESVPCMHL